MSQRANLTRVRKVEGFYTESFIEERDEIVKSTYQDPIHHLPLYPEPSVVKCIDIVKVLKDQGIGVDVDRIEGFISLEGFKALSVNQPMVTMATRIPIYGHRNDFLCPIPTFHLCHFNEIFFIGLYIKGVENRKKFAKDLARFLSQSGYEIYNPTHYPRKQYKFSCMTARIIPTIIIVNFLTKYNITNLSINSFGRKISLEHLLFLFNIDHSNPTQSLDRYFIPTPFHPKKKDFLYNNFDISYTISNPKPKLTYIKNYHVFLCSSRVLDKGGGVIRRDYNLLGERESGYSVINLKENFKIQNNSNSPTYIKKITVYQPGVSHLAKAYIATKLTHALAKDHPHAFKDRIDDLRKKLNYRMKSFNFNPIRFEYNVNGKK